MDTDKAKEKLDTVLDKANYEDYINNLKSERDRLERELKKEYRNARKYVRSHPEQGVGLSLLGGFVIGFIVGKLFE